MDSVKDPDGVGSRSVRSKQMIPQGRSCLIAKVASDSVRFSRRLNNGMKTESGVGIIRPLIPYFMRRHIDIVAL